MDYLWWLCKNSTHLPQSNYDFKRPLIPDAPADMYAALGKNDQRFISYPAKNLSSFEMGERLMILILDFQLSMANLWAKLEML